MHYNYDIGTILLTMISIKSSIILATSCITIPYALAITCNIMYGSPLSKKSYLSLLHPRKVYLLNCAFFSQFTKIKYAGVVIESYLYYSYAQLKNLHKDIKYGSQSNRLDVHLPVDSTKNKKVYIFVYGGTWSSGSKALYASLCRNISNEKNAVVVCPDYSKYPKGFVDDMIGCIVDCIAWVHDNIEIYGGNKSPHLPLNWTQNSIVLVGHSAGAHLIASAVLELESNIQEHSRNEINTQAEPATVYPYLTLYNSITQIIGLAGVYDVGQHYGYESARGVQDVSKMSRAFCDQRLFARYSPTLRIKEVVDAASLPCFHLIHGTVDRTVPLWSSQVFHAELCDLQCKDFQVILTEISDCGHADIVMCMFKPSSKYYKDVMSLL